ncbi:hypothetical protein H9P43_009005 [Blastocladiella emersonii ATCC 22665]|nr:hypothetical protein H9P43_009005 [Blastocladiella emersonii ATCC 22665]
MNETGAPEEIDFSRVPLGDRLAHKNWKARQSGYEELAKTFRTSPETSPVYSRYASDLRKMAVDTNMAAQETAVLAIATFMEFAPTPAALPVIPGILKALVEKSINSTRQKTRESAAAAFMFALEIAEVGDPVTEPLVAAFTHKLPKLVAAAVALLRDLVVAFGIQVIPPKPLIKHLAKLFSHPDKNVRAETTLLTVALHGYLGPVIANFLEDLKPVQKKELEDAFAATGGARLTPTRLTRRAKEAAEAAGADDAMMEDADAAGGAAPMDEYDLAEPVDVLRNLPAGFFENVASKKWAERKEALTDLLAVLNTPRIKDDRFHELVSVFVKTINKDANINVVIAAVQCVGALAKGLRGGFATYRHAVVPPLLEKCKEKRANVLVPICAALDAVFAATSLDANVEDTLAVFAHKNPSVKGEAVRFLVRCLKETRALPGKAELKAIVDALIKLMDDSQADVREAAAEGLACLIKLVGERPLAAALEKLDGVKKTKVTEFVDKVEIKGVKKAKPAVAARPPPAAGMARPGLGARAAPPPPQPAFDDVDMDTSDAPPPADAPAARLPPHLAARMKAREAERLRAKAERDAAKNGGVVPPPAPPPASAAPAYDEDAMMVESPPVSAVRRPVLGGAKRPGSVAGGPPARPASAMARPSSAASAGPGAARQRPMSMMQPPVSSAPAAAAPRDELAPLAGDPKAKIKRAGDDRGAGKWVLDGLRPDLVEFLREQAAACFTPQLVALLFSTGHYKEREFMAGLTAIDGFLVARDTDCLHHADVILKYLTLRFQDTSTTIVLKCLDVVDHLTALLDEHGHSLSDYEANAFFPSFLGKLGDNKETVRARTRQLLVNLNKLYAPAKLFMLLVKATESKNARMRAECIEELGAMIARNGFGCCNAKTVPAIAAFVAEREATVRTAALNTLVEIARAVGETQMYKLVGRLPEKEKSMLQQKIKRAGVPETPPTPGRDVMDVDTAPLRNTPRAPRFGAAGAAGSRESLYGAPVAAAMPPQEMPAAFAPQHQQQAQAPMSPPVPSVRNHMVQQDPYAAYGGAPEVEQQPQFGGYGQQQRQQQQQPQFGGYGQQQPQGQFGGNGFGQPQQQQNQFGQPQQQNQFGGYQQQQAPPQQQQQMQFGGYGQQQHQQHQQMQSPMQSQFGSGGGFGYGNQQFQQPQQQQQQGQFGSPFMQAQQQQQQLQSPMLRQQQQVAAPAPPPAAAAPQSQFAVPSRPASQYAAPPAAPAATHFALTPERVDVSSYSSRYEPAPQQHGTLMDLLVTQVTAADAHQALDALRQVEKIIPNNPQLLVGHADQLVNAVALQIRLAFTAADTAPVMRLCKHLLHTLLQFFDAPLLACSVSLDTLGQLMTELLTRLLDADLPNRSSGVQLVKALNMLMVRILDKSPANQIFAVLLRMLGDALPVLQTGEQVKYAELTMKCLWKVIRMLPTYLKEDGKVNVAELLRDIHFFLEHIQAADWRRRETPLGDVPIRTIKTMLSELSLAYGDAILDHFHLVDDKDDAYVFTYTKNLLASQARKRAAAAGGTMGSASSLPGSQYGSAASLTGGSRSGSVADASEAHQQHQYQQQHYGAGAGAGLGSPAMQRPGSAMSHRSYASSAAFAAAAASAGSGTETVMAALAAREATAAADKEAFDKLMAIFSKIGKKDQSKEGIFELYQFQLAYPHMQALVDDNIASHGEFFMGYIKRNLKLLEQQQTQQQQQQYGGHGVPGGARATSMAMPSPTPMAVASGIARSTTPGGTNTTATVTQLRERLARMRESMQTSGGRAGSSSSLNSQ